MTPLTLSKGRSFRTHNNPANGRSLSVRSARLEKSFSGSESREVWGLFVSSVGPRRETWEVRLSYSCYCFPGQLCGRSQRLFWAVPSLRHFCSSTAAEQSPNNRDLTFIHSCSHSCEFTAVRVVIGTFPHKDTESWSHFYRRMKLAHILSTSCFCFPF